MSDLQTTLAGEVALWLQRKCGDPWEFLGCHNLTGITVPRGETNPIYCRVGKNQFAIQRTWRGTPGLGSLTILAYDTVLNELQELACAFNLVALHSADGNDDDPTNYRYLYYYNGVEITSEATETHVAGMSPEQQSVVTLSMPASFRGRLKVKKLQAQPLSVSSITANDLNGVAFCDDPSCDNFGNLSTIGCQTGYTVSDGPTAKIIKFTSGGNTIAGIASPFTNANHMIKSVDCNGNVVIATNGTATEYAYSLDGGTTWTVITTPTKLINQVYMVGTKVWFAAQDGYIYYSSNRGATVSVQHAGTATTQSLNDISAADSLTIYAVGDNNAFILSEDGGIIWSAKTGPAAAIFPNDLYKVIAIPGTETVFVGDEQGNIYRSQDKGDTWETVFTSNTGTAGGIRGLVACDCNVLLMAANDSDPYFYGSATGVVYQSVDGGNSWFGVDMPDNDGINDVICCDVNRYWAVGPNGFVAQISGAVLTNLV